MKNVSARFGMKEKKKQSKKEGCENTGATPNLLEKVAYINLTELIFVRVIFSFNLFFWCDLTASLHITLTTLACNFYFVYK